MMIKLGTLFWLVLASATGFAMFAVKYGVQALEEELARTRKAVIAEQQEIRVLDAEWAYLTRPETLEELNRRYLSLAPIATKQLRATFTDIPLRPPAPMPVADVEAADREPADTGPAESGPEVNPAAPAMPAPPATPPPLAAPVVRAAAEKPAGDKPAGAAEIAKPVPTKVAAKPAAPRRPRSLDELIAQIAASR
jgi:hypothetical protein